MPNRYSNWNPGWNPGRKQGSRGDYRTRENQQDFSRSDFEHEAQHLDEHQVGRDFMSNQPRFEQYGEMTDVRERNRGRNRFNPNRFNQQGSRWGQERGGFQGSQGSYRGNKYQASRFAGGPYSEPGGNYYAGSEYEEFDRGAGLGYQTRGERDDYGYEGEGYLESGRRPFDESIAGRPYWGSYRSDEWESTRPRNVMYGYGRGPTQSNRYDSRYDRTDQRNREDRSIGERVRDFFGVGPKGYKRSDDRIREEVSESLADDPEIDASEIEIQVKDGEVTLTGNVDDRRQKRLAEYVAEDVRGVHDVHNQIRVSMTFGGSVGETASSGKAVSSSRKDRDKEQAA